MTQLGQLALAGFVGLLSGTHTSIWGMYKDAPHEGFTVPRFLRSAIIGAIVAVVIQAALQLPLPKPSALVVLFGLAYAAERGIVEVWKTFFREEDQSKYFIPMQFAMWGKPIQSRAARWAAGCAYVAIVAVALYGIHLLDAGRTTPPTTVQMAIAGLVVGSIIAAGGAWKDGPKEGFDPLKFFRSPIMTVVYAVILSRFVDSYLLVAAASIGFERATAETYKTFFFPSKPRGKFAGKPILHGEMLSRRQYFVPVYVAIWIFVLISGGMALRESGETGGVVRGLTTSERA